MALASPCHCCLKYTFKPAPAHAVPTRRFSLGRRVVYWPHRRPSPKTQVASVAQPVPLLFRSCFLSLSFSRVIPKVLPFAHSFPLYPPTGSRLGLGLRFAPVMLRLS